MSNDIQDVYVQLIEIQKNILDAQQATHEELNSIRRAISERITPLEEKVSKHEHIFSSAGKVVTWLVPSGTMIGIVGWLAGFFGHH